MDATIQHRFLHSAFVSLHAIKDRAFDQLRQDCIESQGLADRHRQAIEALDDERAKLDRKTNQTAEETYGLLSRESALRSQHCELQNRTRNLESQVLINRQVCQQGHVQQWLADVLRFLDPKTLVVCSLVCKRWMQELLKSNVFVKALKSFPAPDIMRMPSPLDNDSHLKFTLTIFQLDKFSYICDIDSKSCSSCVSTVKTDESQLIIYICEREPATYLKELVFARNALAIDKCIQEMNSDISKKNASYSDVKSHYERLNIEEKRIQNQLASLSKAVLDLKTQCASDSHTLMFLEREFDSMSSEYQFNVKREHSKRLELDMLKEENRNRRLNQEHQRELLMKSTASMRER